MKSNSFFDIRVGVCPINLIFDTVGRIAAVGRAKKTILQMSVLLIQSKPHFTWMNCASFAVSAVRKSNILVTKDVLDKGKHMSRNPDPTTRAMWAFVVAALTHTVDVDDADAIVTPPTAVAVSQKVGHRLKVDRKMTRIKISALYKPTAL
jgi:hypothetical protein